MGIDPLAYLRLNKPKKSAGLWDGEWGFCANRGDWPVYLAVDLDKDLEESLLTTWNAKVVEYDNDRFPFNEWILNRIQKMGYPLEDLTQIHEVIPDKEVYKVTKQLCADTDLPEYRRMVNDFVRDEIVPKGYVAGGLFVSGRDETDARLVVKSVHGVV